MDYLVQSWTRCVDGKGTLLNGEELMRTARVRHYGHIRKVMFTLMHDFSVVRVTLSSPITSAVWDLYRGAGRDTTLDSSMRDVEETTGVQERVVLDVGPGVTQEQLRQAVEELTTRSGELGNS